MTLNCDYNYEDNGISGIGDEGRDVDLSVD